MAERLKAAVIGGGIVGTSILYWLSKLGWKDIALFEKRNLTSGSTWHAAGNVTYFGHYPEITGLYVNSVKAYLAAQEESGQDVGFHPSGSIRLATTQAERNAYESLAPLYENLDADYRIVGNDEIAELHPLLNTSGLFGAAHTPGDGHVDPTGTTHALAKAAKQRGAEVRINSPVSEIRKTDFGWEFRAAGEIYEAQHLIVATSFWAREMLTPLGLNLPIYPIQHHEIVTDNVSELSNLDFELPTVRDPAAPANIRQERNGLLCGIYEKDPVFWATDGIPPDFKEELLAPDLDRLIDPYLMRVIERIPAFGEAGIKITNNGPICYTPDGVPLLGPVSGFEGLWLATGFSIGIGTGGGSAEYLARWMNDGEPPYPLPIVYPSRFPNNLSKEHCLAKATETYGNGYTMPESVRFKTDKTRMA